MILRIKPPAYRARRTATSEWSWAIERRSWFGWKKVESGFDRRGAMGALAYHANGQEIVYPSKDEIGKVDPLGIRTGEGPPF